MYITPDLTIKEREINRALHQELKRCKEASEKDLIIKRGKIVNRQAGSDPNQPAAQTDNLLDHNHTIEPNYFDIIDFEIYIVPIEPQANNHSCIKLSVLVPNCQSIVAKKADLNCLIEVTNPDIIIASETWLKPSINFLQFFPLNYTVYRKDWEDGYGGVLLAHKITLTSYQLHMDSPCEIFACKFEQIINPLVICSAYRPPNFNIEHLDYLCKELQNITYANPSATIWIGEDLNLPDINWTDNTITGHQYPLSLNEHF